MKNNDDDFGWYEWGVVAVMFCIAFFVLWLTSGSYYR